eukprot:GHRQ01003355.1.p2 GENE.GHRQ01003355.1~~GHRQ01003355.1.p2  ORF type:complete len:128 (+),score=22.83 GHRQ01003355.1:328-711(+)
MHQHVVALEKTPAHADGSSPQHHPHHPQAGHGVEPVIDMCGQEGWAHHSPPAIVGRHSVRLSDDVTVTVAEDEPVKDAVESDIARISQRPESKLRHYFDKMRGGVDTPVPFPSFQDAAVSWLGAFLG